MNPPEPRLNKLPFIATSLVCLTVVVLVGLFATNKFAALPMLTSVGFLIIGMAAFLVPFLSDYAADSHEASARVRDELELQIKRVQAAAESLGRAAAQIKAIEEAVQKSARDAETLPYRMQEKLAEFNTALAEKENDEREALERELEELRAASSDQLRAVAEKISKATTDWVALEAATRRQLAAAQAVAGKIDEALARSLDQAEARMNSLGRLAATPATAAPPAEPVAPAEAEPAPAATPTPSAEPVAAGEAPATEAPKARKPRPTRKPKPEDTLVAMSESSVALEADPAAAPSEETAAPAPAEAATSSDGATRLLATAYIGIGNKLFIRGDGPGLSWEKGVPMQFVSIGKWGWSTHDAAAPVAVKLYKNDETAALSGGLTIEPGRHTEITALF